MRIEITGALPRGCGLTRRALESAARAFADASRRRLGASAPVWHEVVVHLVRDCESDAMHRAIMGVAGATDVITQAYDSIPPEPSGLFGEIFVNLDQAARVAPKRDGWSVAREILLYVAHGMDHLSGADDHDPADYVRMRRRELRWLRSRQSSVK